MTCLGISIQAVKLLTKAVWRTWFRWRKRITIVRMTMVTRKVIYLVIQSAVIKKKKSNLQWQCQWHLPKNKKHVQWSHQDLRVQLPTNQKIKIRIYYLSNAQNPKQRHYKTLISRSLILTQHHSPNSINRKNPKKRSRKLNSHLSRTLSIRLLHWQHCLTPWCKTRQRKGLQRRLMNIINLT